MSSKNRKSVLAAAKKDHNEHNEKNGIQHYISTPNKQEEEYLTNKEQIFIDIISPYYYPRLIYPYSTICREPLILEKTRYLVKDSYHYLKFVYLTIELPKITVLRAYEDLVEIAWTSNVLHSIIGNGLSLEFMGKGDKVLFSQTLNQDRLDDYRATEVQNIKGYDIDIGNRKELLEWNNELVTDQELSIILPFYFNDKDNLAIPINKLFSTSTNSDHTSIKVVFKSDFNLKILKLLRMRVRSTRTNSWTDLIKPEIYFLNITNKKLVMPQLWAEYSLLDETEHLAQIEEQYKVIITDYIYSEETDIIDNSTINIELNQENKAIKCIKLFAQNYKANMHNNNSNYTTDHNNHKTGTDPIQSISIKYGSVYRVLPMGSVHTSRITKDRYFHGYCNDKGYHTITFSHEPSRHCSDISCIPDGSALLQVKPKSNLIHKERVEYDAPNISPNTYKNREWESEKPKGQIEAIINYIKETYDELLINDSQTNKYVLKICIHVIKVITYGKGIFEIQD